MSSNKFPAQVEDFRNADKYTHGGGGFNTAVSKLIGGVNIVPFATTVTPDIAQGSVWEIGALTAGITIANPIDSSSDDGSGTAPVGSLLTLIISQDATGSRTVTWGNAYRTVATPVATTLSKANTATFRFDGTSWLQVGSCTGMT
jgi:hypothetical protein